MCKIRGNPAIHTFQYCCDTLQESQGTNWAASSYCVGGYFEAEQTTANTPIIVDSANGTLTDIDGMLCVGYSSAGGRGINIQYGAEVSGTLVRASSGHGVVVGFQNLSPERTCKIHNIGSNVGCIRYADNDYLLDARNSFTNQNTANQNFISDSGVSADITSKNNRSRLSFGPNWASDASHVVATLSVDSTTLMPATTETNLIGGGTITGFDYDWGGLDAYGQVLRLSSTQADVGPTTRQRLGISGQVVFPPVWIG
jgi:hypothetical protein